MDLHSVLGITAAALAAGYRVRVALILVSLGLSSRHSCGDVPPDWSSDRAHRLIVRVEPVPNLAEASDEMVARVHVDFGKHLGQQRADLASLQVVASAHESGQPLEFEGNPYASTRGDRPLRFYDDSIPWEFQEHEGIANVTEGKGTPIRRLPGGARFFNLLGKGESGHVAWAHTQIRKQPAQYAIYFNVLTGNASDRLAPAGFIGDGSNRCTPVSQSFAPVLQGRAGLADFNGDDLFDLMIGNLTGTILWYTNTGSPGQPRFGPGRFLCTEDGQPIDVGWSSGPAALDWDSDGKQDLIVGAEKACFVLFRNVSDGKHPIFRLEGLVKADGKPLEVPKSPCEEDPDNQIYLSDYNPSPEIADWDGDGDLDLLAGGYITGRVWYYENTANDARKLPTFAFRGAIQADGKDLDVSWMALPTSADFDGDGDLDLVCGAMQMDKSGGEYEAADRFLWYFENTGARSSPKLVHRPFPAKGHFAYGTMGCARATDFNRDGLTDLVVSVAANVILLPNIGTPTKPLFDATTPAIAAEWGNAQLGFNDLADYNADGWVDVLTSDSLVPFNAGRGGMIVGPRMLQRLPMSVIQLNSMDPEPGPFQETIPLAGAAAILHTSPRGDHWDCRSLCDLDGDGLLDILLGDHQGFVWFHRNLGSRDKPVIDVAGQKLETTLGMPVRVGLTYLDVAPFDILQGARTNAASGDFNRDRKTDLVVCDTFGYVRVFTQAGGEKLLFSPGIDVGRFGPTAVTAQRVDWDGDGWDDILATYYSGRILLLINKQSSDQPLFAAPQEIQIPGCFGYPWSYVADWNHDGDADLIIDQYGYTRFVERSFVDHGYRPAQLVRYEQRQGGATK